MSKISIESFYIKYFEKNLKYILKYTKLQLKTKVRLNNFLIFVIFKTKTN